MTLTPTELEYLIEACERSKSETRREQAKLDAFCEDLGDELDPKLEALEQLRRRFAQRRRLLRARRREETK